MSIELFEDPVWQMAWGERAALEGLLSQLQPRLAIEIGSAEGACLRRIAAHSAEVHSFDLVAPSLEQPDHVTLHTGDSHQLLPELLERLATDGRNVDFVMVDGDHSPDGVRRDLEDLLNSRAIAQTAIVIHDTANERVRQGVDAVHYAAWPKVSFVDLDWVPGRLFTEPKLRDELWYGLGLVLVDASAPTTAAGHVYQQRYAPSAPLLAEARNLRVARAALGDPELDGDPIALRLARLDQVEAELALLRREANALGDELGGLRDIQSHLDDCTAQLIATREQLAAVEAAHSHERDRREELDRVLAEVMESPSWKLTKPLRSAKSALSPRG